MNRQPWLKHDHLAHQDEFIQQSMLKFGPAGYSNFFIIIELVHLHGNSEGSLKISRSNLCQKLRSRWPQVGLYLDWSRTQGKLQFNLISDEVELKIKNYRKWQYNIKSKSVPNPSQIRTDIEGDREEEEETTIGPAVQKPKMISPIQQIVEAYKMAKNVSRKDKGWDKQNFSRYAKAAKGLLDCFKGDLSRAGAYVFAQGEEFDSKNISWTLETIARHAWDNKGKIDEHELSTLDAAGLLEQSRPVKAAQERSVANRNSRPVRAGEISVGEYGKLDGPGNDLEP